jgi:hypothetical protein
MSAMRAFGRRSGEREKPCIPASQFRYTRKRKPPQSVRMCWGKTKEGSAGPVSRPKPEVMTTTATFRRRPRYWCPCLPTRRRTNGGQGARPTGSYWGAAGEQIDLVSGNLDFTLPLIQAKSRGGWGATFGLSYNSQLWRQDLAGTFEIGKNVGYGFGWRLQAGSITPVWYGGLL